MIVEVYFSVDIESDGPIPGPYSMISFGAVACAMRHSDGSIEQLDPDKDEHRFYAELKPISDKFIPEALAISGLDRDKLILDAETPANAMDRFSLWVKTTTEILGDSKTRSVFAAWPLSFDWMFTYWYMVSFSSMDSPFGFSSAIDMKSIFATKANIPLRKVSKRSLPAELRSHRSHTHNALDDAAEQGVTCYKLLAWSGPTIENVI